MALASSRRSISDFRLSTATRPVVTCGFAVTRLNTCIVQQAAYTFILTFRTV